MGDLARYLEPGYFVESSAREVEQRAKEIVSDEKDSIEVARRLFYWVRDEIRYNVYSKIFVRNEHRATVTLKRGDGNCMQKATLLCALLRAAKIPARLGFADIRNLLIPPDLKNAMGTDLFVFHGFAEAHLNGKWVKMTPAFDIKTCQNNGIVPVEFDGSNDAMLSPVDVNGRPHFQYVKFRGTFFDFPFEDMVKVAETAYEDIAKREKFE